MTAQERLDYLLETQFVPTNTNVTIGMIRDTIGLTPEQYGLVRGTLDTAITTLKADANPIKRMQGIDLQDALSAMLDRGTSLSGLDRQATIDFLAAFGKWPDAIRDAVKALGGTTKPRWQIEGYKSEPTLEQIEAEIAAENLVALKRQLESEATDALQTYREALTSWDGSGDPPVLGAS